MKRKIIEDQIRALGVTDEAEIKKAVDAIMDENGKDITPLKTQIANLQEDIEVQKGVVETKNTKIKELEGIDIEAIKKQAREEGFAEGSKEVEEMKFDTALETALKGFKVKDKASIMGHLNMKKIGREVDKETGEIKITGLEEQITPIKENEKLSYLFDSEEGEKPLPNFSVQQTNNQNSNSNNGTLLDALKEKFK
ncbi:MAG: phage scaffolding protein [Clostridia bacterium]|jgi:phage minor structural protein GP20|nr:phage scaffolding protein [Clostridia bacterium]DAN82469.1 MAG TPA: minor structural protein [Caudoviricetes sp.]DAT10738.1 MAG TPA: minor structural protein [Caudoviricetes sp.]